MDRRTFNKTALSVALLGAVPLGGALSATGTHAAKITADTEAITRTGGTTILSKAAIRELQTSLRGQMLHTGTEGYDEVRQVWNGMIDKRPGLIVRCLGAADVKNTVDFARSNDLLVAVRGGGHSIAGKAVCEGGIMIDLSLMCGVRVDPIAKTARVQGGALLGDLDKEAQPYGLTTTAGTVSHTGAAGLTLGGGHGRIARTHGLACDNVLEFEIVTPDGTFRRANAEENPDLYWGLRGGGGNFGVVTSFLYQLHQVGPIVLAGGVMYPLTQAKEVFDFYQEFTATVPNEMAVDAVIIAPPGIPGFIMVDICYNGPVDEGERLVAPLKSFGKPMADHIAPINYVELQTRADAGTPPGRQYYNKAGLMTELDNGAISALVDRLNDGPEEGADPTRTTLVIVQQLGGAIAQRAPDDTAYVHRDARFDFLTLAGWTNPERSEENMKYLRDTYALVAPHAIGFYSNHMVDSDLPRTRSAFRSNYDRLVQVKNKYDPTNLFHLNANIKPTI